MQYFEEGSQKSASRLGIATTIHLPFGDHELYAILHLST